MDHFESFGRNKNCLDFWKTKANELPYLSALARRVLAIPASSSPVERLFSNAGNVITSKRASLLSHRALELTLLHLHWDDMPPGVRKANTYDNIKRKGKN